MFEILLLCCCFFFIDAVMVDNAYLLFSAVMESQALVLVQECSRQVWKGDFCCAICKWSDPSPLKYLTTKGQSPVCNSSPLTSCIYSYIYIKTFFLLFWVDIIITSTLSRLGNFTNGSCSSRLLHKLHLFACFLDAVLSSHLLQGLCLINKFCMLEDFFFFQKEWSIHLFMAANGNFLLLSMHHNFFFLFVSWCMAFIEGLILKWTFVQQYIDCGLQNWTREYYH